jgi:MinD-like ATPase involved in chromosome partitioning or flagellar assembly
MGGSDASLGVGAAPTVRVVVRFSGREAEAAVPADQPVRQLLPELLAVVFGAEDAATASQLIWNVGHPGGAPFPGRNSLRDLQVRDGSVLQLEQAGQWQPAGGLPEAALPNLDIGDFGLPRQRTLAALPRRQGPVRRLAAAAATTVARQPAPPTPVPIVPAPGTHVPPAQLTVPRRPRALQRARGRWRESAYEHRLDEMIRTPHLKRCATIAVMSPKGGVGKTTLCALLGTLFALLRRDRVVAVDSNPDFGSLGRSLTPAHGVYVDDLLDVLDTTGLTVTAVDARLGRAVHGLMVLPVPGDPARMARLDEDAYVRVVRRLQALVGMVLLDCGTGLHDAAARAALQTADQVLLVTDANPATASLVAEAAGLLRERRTPTWLVVNRMGSGSRLRLASLEAYVPHARGLLVLPEDEAAANRVAAGTFNWPDAPPPWRRALREVAAVLVAAWPSLGIGA